jgi:hypothetical protein
MIVNVKAAGELTAGRPPAAVRVHVLPAVGEIVHLPGPTTPWRVLVVEHHGIAIDDPDGGIPWPSITVEACQYAG